MNYARRAGYAGLGWLIGNVPGAVIGYKMAESSEKSSQMKRKYGYQTPSPTPKKRKVYKVKTAVPKKFGKARAKRQMKTKFKKVPHQFRKAPLPRLVGVATSNGLRRFKRPSYLGFASHALERKYAQRGWSCVIEGFGSIIDKDCTYLYHSTFNPIHITRVVLGALVRSLLRKAGIEVAGSDQELAFKKTDNSAGCFVQFVIRDPISKTYAAYDTPTADNMTFAHLVNNVNASQAGNWMVEYMKNDNTNNRGWYEPYSIALYLDIGGENRLLSIIHLEDEMIDLVISSEVTVQNRTKGNDATGGEADRVDNQPVTGYIYEFKNGDPRLVAGTQKGGGIVSVRDEVLNTGNFTGVFTCGSEDMAGSSYTSWKEPPNANIWKNIKKVSKVQLEPGDMKRSKIYSTFHNKFPELLKKLRASVTGNYDANTTNLYRMLPSCTSQIIALEEALRTPSTNKITLQYQIEHRLMAMTHSRKKKAVLLPSYADSGDTAIAQWPGEAA